MKIYIRKYVVICVIFPLQILCMEQSDNKRKTAKVPYAMREKLINNPLDEDENFNIAVRQLSGLHQPISKYFSDISSEQKSDSTEHIGSGGDTDFDDDPYIESGGIAHSGEKIRAQVAAIFKLRGYTRWGKASARIIGLLKDIDKKIICKWRFENDATLLHLAAQVGAKSLCVFLVEGGLEPSAVDCQRKTPLDYANDVFPGRTNRSGITGKGVIDYLTSLTAQTNTQKPKKKRKNKKSSDGDESDSDSDSDEDFTPNRKRT